MKKFYCSILFILLTGFVSYTYGQTKSGTAVPATTTTDDADTGTALPAYPRLAVKNNLIYDATLTPNLSLEYRWSERWSTQLSAGFNPFSFSRGERYWKHLLVMPELRWWFGKKDNAQRPTADNDLRRPFYRNFLSLNVLHTHYNLGVRNLPLRLYKWDDDEGRQGDAVAAGLSLGHLWQLGRRWYLEGEIGADVGYAKSKRYDCNHCDRGHDDKPFLMPKAALSLVVDLSRHRTASVVAPPVEPEPERVIEVQKRQPYRPATTAVAERTGVAGQLAETHDVLQHISKYRPYDATRILRKEKGALYVHFPLDRTTLSRDFRDNAPTLDQIIDVTRLIMADTTSRVERIQIIGLASIEGNLRHNTQLAGGRALALQHYVQQQLDVPDSLFETINGGEAWAEFRDQINDLTDNGQPTADNAPSQAVLQEVLTIIDTETDLDRREQRIKRMNGGRTYQWLKRNLLADQRNSGYVRIYWDYVPDESARTINSASVLIGQERYAEALTLLQGVKSDPRSYNSLATALYMTGHRDEAIRYFRLAAEQGNRQAETNLRRLLQEQPKEQQP